MSVGKSVFGCLFRLNCGNSRWSDVIGILIGFDGFLEGFWCEQRTIGIWNLFSWSSTMKF